MEELSDGAIVWVKLSNCWWPGEVIGDEKLSDDFLSSLRKKPLAVVKFFDEDAYEYVKNPNFIFKYNCPRKTEFLRKGLEQYRAKNKHMEKFPADVMHAERMTGGDPNIVNSTDFLPQKKERYSGLFQDSVKGKDKKNKSLTPTKAMAIPVVSAVGRKTMHEIRILAQPSAASKPATSGSERAVEKLISPSSQTYHCHKCGFSSSRQNVIVIHTKNCRATGAAVVPSPPSTPSGATGVAKAKEITKSSEKVNAPDSSQRTTNTVPTTSGNRSTRASIVEDVDIKNTAKLHEEPLKGRTPTSGRVVRGSRVQQVKTGASNSKSRKQTVNRRREKRGQSPKELTVGTSVDVDADADEVENVHQRPEPDESAKPVPDATTIHSPDKGKTDAKLKKELLADWSEDEQDDDSDAAVDETQNTQDNAEEKKNVAKESFSSMSPQKETDNDAESAKVKQKDAKESHSDALEVTQSKANTLASGVDTKMLPSDEESSTAKDSDKETTSDSPLTTSTSVSSTTTAPPLVSPCTTIKYRNIPKKQKREFIEVTNDDASSVHGPVQDKAPSREGSTASSSSTTGSNDTLGNGITTLFTGTGATDRPISAKQLILNRATRCSSKSLSGDETLKPDDGKLDSGKNDRGESQRNREAIKQTESIANEEVSCFDFKDDDEQEKSPQSSQFSSAAHRRSGSLADRKSGAKEAPQEEGTVSQKRRSSGRKKSVTEGALAEKEQQNSNEATTVAQSDVRSTHRKENSDSDPDHDAQLSKAIDFLLETDVPKLPDDLKQVVATVSEKIDCNRTLPPKERGKRIFKTRNKSSLAAISDSKDSAGEPGARAASNPASHGVEQQEAMDHEQSPDEAIPKPADVPVDSEPTVANSGTVDKKAGASGTKFENSDFAAIKAKRTKYSREEDYQNPSVTSSEQGTEEAVVEPAAALLERDETPPVANPKPEVQQTPPTPPGSSPNAKGRRGKQKKPTPLTTPPPTVAMVESVEAKTTKAVARGSETTRRMDVENEASTKDGVETDHQENVAKKIQRKSSEKLLPDSSGSEPAQSRRRTKMKHQRGVEERVHPVEAESSRRSKRYRKETASDSAHTHTISKPRVPTNVEESVVGNAPVAKETENVTTAVVAEDEGMKQPEPSSVSVDDEVAVEKDVKATAAKQEKPAPDSGKSLKRKQDARATAESSTGKMERLPASDGHKAQECVKPTDEELGKDRKLKPNRHTVGSSGAVVSSSPVVMGTKPTPTDLQVAEALIHLPEAAVAGAAAAVTTATLAVLPVVAKEPETGVRAEKLAPSLTKEDDDLAVSSSPSVKQLQQPSAVVIGAAQSSSRSGTGSIAMRSINPRKRHLQSMLLTEDAAGEQKRTAPCPKTAHVESTSTEPVSSPVVSGGTEQPKQQQKKNTPIPERKKKESAGESEPLPSAVPVDEDKFDIDSMPIVMGDNGLLVDEVVANEHTAGAGATPKTVDTMTATSTRVIKNVNGSGMTTTTVDHKHQEPPPSVSSGPVVTTMKGGVAAKEQIVITSKGTVLTTSSPAVAVKSKLQPATKSDVKVTSAITLGTTGVRVSATAGALSATATTRRAQAEQTAPSSSSNGAPKVPVADEEQRAKEKRAAVLAAVPSFSVASSAAPKKMITKKLLGDPAAGTLAPASSSIVIATSVAERRYSGDEPSSSVSSSSSTDQQHTAATMIDVGGGGGGGGGNGSSDSSKKGHRVMKITPQKLQQFSRLGYVEDKGKRKVMTASGMRQFKREQLLQQQQQQHKLQPTATDNALPTQSKQASTADARKKPKHTTTKTVGSGSGVVLASSSTSRSAAAFALAEAVSSGGNVVVAAAADSSVQELQGGTTVSLAKQLVVTDADGERNAMIIETILPAATIKSSAAAPLEKVTGTVAFESTDGSQLLEGSPSSSTSAASEVILGGAVESVVPSIGVVEPSSSSSSTAAAGTAGAGEQESQYIAVNAEHFGGPPNLFYLCSVRDEGLVPVNNQLLYLDASNQLVALAAGQQHSGAGPTAEDIINQAEVIIPTGGSNGADLSGGSTVALASATGDAGAAAVNLVAAGGGDVGAVVETGSTDGTQQSFLLNTQDGQQIILDQQSLMALAAGGDTPHLLTADGQQILLQEATQEWLAAFAGTGQQHQQQSAGPALSALVTPEGTQIILAPDCIELQEQTALLPTEVIQVHPSSTIETNAILTKPPIMSTVEVPSKNGIDPSASGSTVGVDQRLGRKSGPSGVPGAGACRAVGTVAKQSPPGASILVHPGGTSVTTNLDETTLAAVIGVPCKPTNVPTSLELPITVTNPVIAKTTTTSSRLNPVLFPVTGGSSTATVGPSDLALPPAAAVVLLGGQPMAAAGTAADRAPTLSSPAAPPSMNPDPPAESITVGAILPQRGATTQEDSDHPDNPDSDDDIQIPNTPDSQLDSGRQIAYDSSDYDEDEEPANTPNDDSGQQQRRNHYEARRLPGHGNDLMVVDVDDDDDDDDDDDEGSNGSEIIPLQPNVVVLDGSLLHQNLGDEVDDGDDDDDDDGIEDDTDGDGDLEDLQQQPPVRTVHCVPTAGRNGAHGASNNDSGIDTTMAATASAAPVAANNAAPPNGARRTVVER